MEGVFQKSLRLFVVSGYCVFVDDFYVDISSVLDGRPNYANIHLFEALCWALRRSVEGHVQWD